MNARRTYQNAPIRQAICAVNFDECADWLLTTPGEIWKSLRNFYPGKPAQNVSAKIEMVPGEGGSPGAFAVRASEATTKLVDEAGVREFAFGPASFSATSHQPYEGWEKFYERITQGVNSYLKFATPGPIRRVGVRYINQIEFSESEVELGEYFTVYPDVPASLKVSVNGFNSRVESSWSDDRVTVVHTFSSAVSSAGNPAVVLDIDVIEQWPLGNSDIDIAEELLRLRNIEREVFEALITDEARRLFNGD
ncbi:MULTISPECIES: TIGR04255 family protein [unclassified Saccharothrix]|uniref:TIGR04255 family protein n=1 Tax=unclassified Saccharothrix TaxID=2593673 RepID=UPI00307DEA52